MDLFKLQDKSSAFKIRSLFVLLNSSVLLTPYVAYPAFVSNIERVNHISYILIDYPVINC